jgi:UTP--glucose-1-phosphate uridylyltransferase
LNEVKKAVIPVAGKGTRFLPATKNNPKEMIPILNIPMIYYVVNEAVQSGIEQIIFVTSSGKESVEDFFDRNYDLEIFLEKNKKYEYLETVQKIGKMVEVFSVRQKEQLGLGHAVLQAKSFISKNERFSVLLGDDLTFNEEYPVSKQLIDVSSSNNGHSVVGVMNIPRESTNRYGIIDGIKITESLWLMKKMVEKPQPHEAPSTLATPGRYLLNHEIFEALELIPRGTGGEFQLTDAIDLLAQSGKVLAYEFNGKRFDTGSVEGYLEATLHFAYKDEKLKKVIEKFINSN